MYTNKAESQGQVMKKASICDIILNFFEGVAAFKQQVLRRCVEKDSSECRGSKSTVGVEGEETRKTTPAKCNILV